MSSTSLVAMLPFWPAELVTGVVDWFGVSCPIGTGTQKTASYFPSSFSSTHADFTSLYTFAPQFI